MKFKSLKITEIEKFNKKFPRPYHGGKLYTVETNGAGEITYLETTDQDIIKWAKKNLPNLAVI